MIYLFILSITSQTVSSPFTFSTTLFTLSLPQSHSSYVSLQK